MSVCKEVKLKKKKSGWRGREKKGEGRIIVF